jgi:hypothetical protein
MLKEDTDSYLRYNEKKIELKKSLLSDIQSKESNLVTLAGKTLTALQTTMIKEVEETGKVSNKTEQEFNEIHDLLYNNVSKKGMKVLVIGRRIFRHALHPAYPFDFPQPLEIAEAFMMYRDLLEYAIGLNTIKKGQYMLGEQKEQYEDRVEDLLPKIKAMLSDIKKGVKK